MLTPGPAFRRRIRLTRPGWKGMGFRGLGQPCIQDPADPTTCYDVTGNVPLTVPTTPNPRSQSGGIDWTQVILAGIKGTAAGVAIQTNPFAPKNIPPGYVYQSGPGGTFISAGGAGSVIPGVSPLTATTMTNLLPILLIGGVVVMFMMSRK